MFVVGKIHETIHPRSFWRSIYFSYYNKSLIQKFYKSFFKIIEDKRFLALELDLVDELLKSDDIHVISEEKVFEALKIWVEADLENRKRNFCSMLKHIRLVLLSPEVIH